MNIQTPDAEQFPEENESVEIGHLAVQAFTAQRPISWRPLSASGDADVGIDAWVQVVHEGQFTQTAFIAQFKGSRRSAYSADQSFVSVRLRLRTVNYYRRQAAPIMLVFADLSGGDKPLTCPVYYRWIHKELDDIAGDAEPGAEYVTIRIATANRLTHEVDIVPFLTDELEARQRLDSLSRAMMGVAQAPAVPAAAAQLASNIKARGSTFLESALAGSHTPWADPIHGTIAWSLKQLNDRIMAGAIDEARTLAQRMDTTQLRDNQEVAEFEFLQATIARWTGDPDTAAAGLSRARELCPTNPRYVTAWIENRLMQARQDPEVVRSLLATIDECECRTEPQMRALRARLFTVLSRFGDAEAELAAIPPNYAAVERMVMLLSQRRFADAISSAAESQSLDVGRTTLLTLRILGARARFDRAFDVRPGSTAPVTGPPELDPRELREIWSEIDRLSDDLSKAGWPPNSEVLMDMLLAVGAAVNKAGEALVWVDSFLRAKPKFAELQLARLKLAVLAGKYEVAIDAAAKLESENTRTVHLAVIHYEQKHYNRVVELVPKLIAIPFDGAELVPEVLALAAHSARRTFDKESEDVCLSRLKSGGFEDRIATFEFATTPASEKVTARQKLLVDLEKHPDSSLLQAHVAMALDPNDNVEARQLVEVTDTISEKRQLTVEETVACSQALSTLGQFDEARRVLDGARLRFGDDPNLLASQALICEAAGDVRAARELLEQILDSSELARSVYANISVRCGLLDVAATQLQAIAAGAQGRRRKKALHGLIVVEFYKGGRSPNLKRLVQEYGALVDQYSEEEEGVFLQTAIMSGILAGVEPSARELLDFQQRAQRYIERFPKSEYFGSFPIPTEGGGQAILEALKKRLGPAIAGNQALEKLRQQAIRGDAAVPYAWRPRVLVPHARSVSHLWEMTKRLGRGNALLALQIDQNISTFRDVRDERRVPLVDGISLLIITDLELWPTVFKMFDRVAISKETLLRIQHDAGPLNQPSATLEQLRGIVRAHLDFIEQPGESDPDTLGGRDGTLEEGKELLATGKYVFYSDDVASRVYALGEEKESRDGLTTVQVLRNAEQLGLLSNTEVAHKLALLIRSNVGVVTIDDRHILVACNN